MPKSPKSILQWLSLVAIIWLQSVIGTNTDFPAYSSQLKNLLSISQIQLNNLAFASDAGKLLGWLSGIATLYLPLWLVTIIGAVLGFIGYGIQYLFMVNKISYLSYWQVFFLTVLAGNSICWINSVCYAIAIRNFPSHQQTVVGLSSSYSGLSAKFYTSIVDAVSTSSEPVKRAKAYLLLNSIQPLMVSMVTAPVLRNIDTVGSPSGVQFGFVIMFLITICTGIYAIVTSLGLLRSLSPLASAISLWAFLLIPLIIPVVIKVKESLKNRKMLKHGRVYHINGNDEQSAIDIEIDEGEESSVESSGGVMQEYSSVRVMEECGVKKMVRTFNFWLYFFVYMFGATLGLVFLNNLGQIAESRGHLKTSSLVALSASFGFFGRLLPSIFDHFFYKSKYMISRTACVLILIPPTAASFFLLLSTRNISLYISVAIIAICTGAISSIAVSITTELFGVKNFSVNHNVVVGNIPVGSFLFGYFAAVLYQKAGHGGTCIGPECYRTSFLLWGSMCSLGSLLSFILYARTRRFYSQSL